MTKPVINTFNEIAPLIIQQYERYLPSAFDDTLSMVEKVNKIIEYCNTIGKVTNDVIEQWNEVMEWVMNDGLNESVIAKLDQMAQDGTLAKIINEEIFGELNKSITDIHINVQSAPYYVKGDGTDETEKIQQAINDAMQQGRALFFPQVKDFYGVSTLKIDYSLMTPDPTSYGFRAFKMYGNGKRNTQIKQVNPTTAPIIQVQGQTGDRSHLGKVTGLIIEGISILGSSFGGSGIYLLSFCDVVLRDIQIMQCGEDGITIDRQIFSPSTSQDQYAYNLRIENSKIMLNNGYGINSKGQQAIGSVLIDNADIESNGNTGININPANVIINGGNILGNKHGAVNIFQTPSFPNSFSVGFKMDGTRVENNGNAGETEVTINGVYSPIFKGVTVMATGGAHLFDIGQLSGSSNAVRQPTIIGGYYAGNKTAGQKFIRNGANSYNLVVINPRIEYQQFDDSATSLDIMDTIDNVRTDMYVIYGNQERTIHQFMGQNETDVITQFLKINDKNPRLRIRSNGVLEWGDGTNNPDLYLSRDSSENIRTNAGLISDNFSPGGTSAKIYGGVGSPEGVLEAGIGSIYLRADGDPNSQSLFYIKTTSTGNTGWVGKF